MTDKKNVKKRLMTLYDSLLNLYGPQNWWPGDSPWEICAGVVLTQNTNWLNVEKAISKLKNENFLPKKGEGSRKDNYYPLKILNTPSDKIADLIRPSGFFNLKTKRLLAVAEWWVANISDNIPHITTINDLRHSLLNINGIGPESADSIILYCFNQPSFVVDTYTKRISSVYLNTSIDIDYHTLRNLFMHNLPHDYQLFNEFHALLVQLGKKNDWKFILESI